MIARLLIPVALITLVNVSAALEADPLSILIGDPALMGRASSSVSASSSSQNSKVYDDFTIREDLRFTIRAVYNGEDKVYAVHFCHQSDCRRKVVTDMQLDFMCYRIFY